MNNSEVIRLASKQRARQIVERLSNGERCNVIAIDLGISAAALSQFLKRHGIDAKKYKKTKGR